MAQPATRTPPAVGTAKSSEPNGCVSTMTVRHPSRADARPVGATAYAQIVLTARSTVTGMAKPTFADAPGTDAATSGRSAVASTPPANRSLTYTCANAGAALPWKSAQPLTLTTPGALVTASNEPMGRRNNSVDWSWRFDGALWLIMLRNCAPVTVDEPFVPMSVMFARSTRPTRLRLPLT